MKLGIDLSPFFTESKYRGIGRYARGLIEELVQVDRADEFHFFNIYGEYEADPRLNEQCFLHRYNCGPLLKDQGERLLLHDPALEDYLHAVADHFIRSSEIDAMLFLSMLENDQPLQADWFSRVFKVGILYDLIPLIYEQEYLSDEEVKERYFANLEFVKKMDLLLAISETTKQDAVQLLGIAPEKIVVINAGVDSQFLAIAKNTQTTLAVRLASKSPYFLFVGGTDPRKNITRAIQAFVMNRRAKEDNVKFVIAGLLPEVVKKNFIQIANEYNAADRVVFIGYVSDEKVIELYQNAVALLFPSLYEGFGLPVLEAMCCGTAVITSNSSSLVEVAKGQACLVDPDHVDSISAGITKVLENQKEVEELIRSAKEHAQTFRWSRVAKEAHGAIQQLRCLPKREQMPRASFVVDSTLLERIVQQFTLFQQPFRWPDALSFAKELYRLEESVLSRGNQHGARILYDVTVVSEWMKAGYETGIARVSNMLRKSLLSYAEIVPVTLKTVRGKTTVVRLDLKTREERETISLRQGDIYLMPELQIREVQVPREYPTVQSLQERGVKAYAIVYDILPLQMPDYFEKKTVGKFSGYLAEILKNYDGVLTDSKAVADDVWRYQQAHRAEIGRTNRINIGYFHLGMDSFQPQEKNVSFSTKILFRGAELVFLMVGTIEPRKGHALVLEAFQKLWQAGVDAKLCIIGRTGWMMEPFVQSMKQHPEYGRKLLFLEGASDIVLEYAYQHASALIQASAGEGFGLPIIEAACNGLPVICSDIPVFREVAGDHALYFSRNVDSLAQCILDFQQARREGNLPVVSRIDLQTWDDAAQRVYKLLVQNEDWSHQA